METIKTICKMLTMFINKAGCDNRWSLFKFVW